MRRGSGCCHGARGAVYAIEGAVLTSGIDRLEVRRQASTQEAALDGDQTKFLVCVVGMVMIAALSITKRHVEVIIM